MAREALATAVNLLVWFGLLFLLYVILISTVPPLEVDVGLGFAALGAITAEGMRRAEHPWIRGSRRLWVAAACFPVTLLRETAQLAVFTGRALVGRGSAGSVVSLRLPPETDAAVAATLLSASPGACVIDIADETDEEARDTTRGRLLTAHLLDPSVSWVERALGGRRLG
ncbi:hypothetical protein [Streptomyces sp. NBC_01190]|uniref:hypothetical protein n=1 Tax=Streptomyces sp. NBC_01190 TaxID=2903767 RepID=UPI0038709EC4|nr:hypothetical protein OG519_04145 [Streptomyces sp. NBC_01190]